MRQQADTRSSQKISLGYCDGRHTLLLPPGQSFARVAQTRDGDEGETSAQSACSSAKKLRLSLTKGGGEILMRRIETNRLLLWS
ncbi:hypothetical protein AJ87_26790 [Rhizobium yanglingense]|nr:hypothetical protein AJ87_26790 [Rhizobium yanglingense]